MFVLAATFAPIAAVAARLALAAIFLIAGVGKARDRPGTWTMLRAFGAGVRLSDWAVFALPIAEFAVAIFLVPAVTARPAALAGIALLLLFTSAVAWQLAHGNTPVCRCFGGAAAAPIGPETIVRNAAIVAISIIVVGGTSPTADAALISTMATSPLLVALAATVAIEAFVIFQILRQQGRQLVRLDAIEAALAGGVASRAPGEHAMAPAFELPTLSGEIQTLESLLDIGVAALLVFVHPTCGPCRALVPRILEWQRELADQLTIAIVTDGTESENRSFLAGFRPELVLMQSEESLSTRYGVTATPAALLIDADGAVGSTIAAGAGAIADVIDAYRASLEPRLGSLPALGQPAPHFERLGNAAGRDLAVLFWDPACAFCRNSVDDVLEWERDERRALVLVTPVGESELIDRGLKAPIVIDPDATIRTAFGAGGTPMAVLVNANGTIASGLAAGREQIGRLVTESSGRT